MFYCLFLIITALFIWYLYRNTRVWEGLHNYNYRNTYNNMFNLSPYGYRSPYNYYNTYYTTGIHSIPHYNTHNNPTQSYLDHYAYHNYQSNLPLTGTINRVGIISKPPQSHSNL